MTDTTITHNGMATEHHQPPKRTYGSTLSLYTTLQVAWGFLESDYLTFAVPNTIFGLVGALSGPKVIDGPLPLFREVLQRAPAVLLFNSYSLLIFDLANQRSPESVHEDRINKPWRPIPSGRVTSEQTRWAILVAAPTALALNYVLGIWKEGLLVQTLNWYYNDLRGGDEVFRDAIIAISYGLANQTSLRLAISSRNSISQQGSVWTAIISGIILTTMNIQDLKDQHGDRIRGRKTIPLCVGDRVCRYALAFFIPFWSLICASFWCLPMMLYCVPLALGLLVAWRVLTKRTPQEDSYTWKLWCVWHATLYALPLLSSVERMNLAD
jgi:4-hydroxybenzoate polyprenyltransferase